MWSSLNRATPHFDTCQKQCGQSALEIGFEKESDLKKQIPLQSECKKPHWVDKLIKRTSDTHHCPN